MKTLIFLFALIALAKSGSRNSNGDGGENCNALSKTQKYLPDASEGEIFIHNQNTLIFYVPMVKGRTFIAPSDNPNLVFEEISGFTCGSNQYFEISCRYDCAPGMVFTFELTENIPKGPQVGAPASIFHFIAVIVGDMGGV